MKVLLAVALLGLASAAQAQAPAEMKEERGSTPPGTARDGSKPADGAIKGGSILPGETGGIPRCNELSGTLREDCLAKERGAATGSSPTEKKSPQDPR